MGSTPLPGEPGMRPRSAIVALGTTPLGTLDATLVTALLEADGWAVTRLGAPEDVLAACEGDSVELVVLDASVEPIVEGLRRFADPPLMVSCSRGLLGDVSVCGLDELLSVVRGSLPRGAGRRWGLSIRRHESALLLSPTGSLDDVSSDRMRQVVDSREGTFDGLLVDLRHVFDATPGGIESLLRWAAPGPSTLVSGPRIAAALALGGAADVMSVFDDEPAALAYLATR